MTVNDLRQRILECHCESLAQNYENLQIIKVGILLVFVVFTSLLLDLF